MLQCCECYNLQSTMTLLQCMLLAALGDTTQSTFSFTHALVRYSQLRR